uniref:hypothetical protein n=1 Tax=Cellulosimicrobium cellulans TaxID=1710 RepID=UPI001C0CE44E
MSTSTHQDDAADRVPPVPSRRARTVSQALISSALGITLVAALAGSTQPREGASFFASTAVSGTVETVSADFGGGLDETQQIQGAIEVLATANALDTESVSPSIEEARSDLGVLLATYLAQQDAARRVTVPAVGEPGGRDGAPEDDDGSGDGALGGSPDGLRLPTLPDPVVPGTGGTGLAGPGLGDEDPGDRAHDDVQDGEEQ